MFIFAVPVITKSLRVTLEALRVPVTVVVEPATLCSRAAVCVVPVKLTTPVVLKLTSLEIVPPSWNVMFPEVPASLNVAI